MNDRDMKELDFFRKHLLPAVRDIMQEVYEGPCITEAEDVLGTTIEMYDATFGTVKPS